MLRCGRDANVIARATLLMREVLRLPMFLTNATKSSQVRQHALASTSRLGPLLDSDWLLASDLYVAFSAQSQELQKHEVSQHQSFAADVSASLGSTPAARVKVFGEEDGEVTGYGSLWGSSGWNEARG